MSDVFQTQIKGWIFQAWFPPVNYRYLGPYTGFYDQSYYGFGLWFILLGCFRAYKP